MYVAVRNLLGEMQARIEVLADRVAERQDEISAMGEILEQHHTSIKIILDDMNRQEKRIYEDRCLINELDHYKLQLEDMVATEQMNIDKEIRKEHPYTSINVPLKRVIVSISDEGEVSISDPIPRDVDDDDNMIDLSDEGKEYPYTSIYSCDICHMPREAHERLCEECAKEFSVPAKQYKPTLALALGLGNTMQEHIGHNVAIVTYGKDMPVNVALECLDCGEVLFDKDLDDDEDEGEDS